MVCLSAQLDPEDLLLQSLVLLLQEQQVPVWISLRRLHLCTQEQQSAHTKVIQLCLFNITLQSEPKSSLFQCFCV